MIVFCPFLILVRSTLRPCLTDQRRPSETPKPPKTQLCTSTVSRSLTKTISNSSSVNSPHKKPIHVMDSNRASVKKSEPTKTAPTSDFEVSSTMDLNFSPIAPSGENPALNLTTLMTLTQMENRLARLEQLNDLKLPSPPTLTGTVSPNTRPIAVSTLRRRPATTGPPAIKVRSPASSDSVDARLRSQTLSVTHCQAGGSALHHAQADVDNTFFVSCFFYSR